MSIKKVVSSIAAVVMTASIVASNFTVSAAGAIDLSMEQKTAKAGESFTLEFSVANLSTNPSQGFEFSIGYDSSLVTIDSLTAGEVLNDAKASEEEIKLNPDIANSVPMISGDLYGCFDYNVVGSDNEIEILWGTGLTDKTYWLDTDGVVFTLTGTVAGTAKAGDVIDFTIGKINRESNVDIVFGSIGEGKTSVVHETNIVQDGKITVVEAEKPAVTAKGEMKKTMYYSYLDKFDKTGISVTAVIDGADVDITEDCDFANTPVNTYDKKGFAYKASLVYNGKNAALADFVGKEVASYDVKIGQRGDADLNHSVDPSDCALITQYFSDDVFAESLGVPAIMSETDNELAIFLADADKDGAVSPTDASGVAQFYAADATSMLTGVEATWDFLGL